jgi:hypothetical protein
MVFRDEANVVAADIPKESLGHKCFLQETLLVAQLIESSTRDASPARTHKATGARQDSAKDSLLLYQA